MPPLGLATTRGTAVRLTLTNQLSPLLASGGRERNGGGVRGSCQVAKVVHMRKRHLRGSTQPAGCNRRDSLRITLA